MDQLSLASQSIMIVAGEASGDEHGANLVSAMRKRKPETTFYGMGGSKMANAGVELLVNLEKHAVMGFTEVIANLRSLSATLRLLRNRLKESKPSLLILIDYADFNLRLAKTAKKYDVPVFYYITPKVWVWRKKRAKKLARYVDQAGVILPFEENYLQKRGVRAKYVGNPTLDSVEVRLSRRDFCKKHNINSNMALVGVLPGSRKKEVAFLLPVFLEAAKRMQQKYSREITFLIPLASSLKNEDLLDAGVREYAKDLSIHILSEDKYELMASCDAVVAASGTVTLELALLDVPMVVAYKFTPTSYMIGKALIDIPYFSLVNILANKEVVTELLQDQVTPATVEMELARILFDENVRKYIRAEFAHIRNSLGGPGASEQAASLAFTTLRDHGSQSKRS